MAKRPIMAKAMELTDEICTLVRDYIEVNRSRRRFWQKDFCEEVGFSTTTFGNLKDERRRGCININTAVILLDAIGYELKIVKKEENPIVRHYKERANEQQKILLPQARKKV